MDDKTEFYESSSVRTNTPFLVQNSEMYVSPKHRRSMVQMLMAALVMISRSVPTNAIAVTQTGNVAPTAVCDLFFFCFFYIYFVPLR